ncbi:GNAT family N-acetyltransferase [Herbiconiux sp. CPCC 205763]|uniref:GNAT family N-acetyltransferase n=1 Tax=Herbiconiux aconitum TaxID=2970913 RepID=A0ABT2GNG0_9MICO|nr:GNAT family N-acetyltransferase [Herbiconiux aconitum]MCS5717759.1 GNAT family N-acetyltransferase [Herbiconiux aconitum]
MTSRDFFVDAWRDALTRLASALGGTASAATPGIFTLTSGVPIPNLNGVLALDRDPDPTVVAAAVAAYEVTGPWSLQVRTTPSAAIVEAATERGLTMAVPLPLLGRDLGEAPGERALPKGITVRAVDPGDTAYGDTLADAFGAPRPLLAPLASPAVLGAAGMRGFLVEDQGVPVATSFGIVSGDTVGLVNIAVVPSHRRRGLGALATEAVITDAVARGARSAYLHATPLGLPLYERLGFELEEQWTMFLPAAS